MRDIVRPLTLDIGGSEARSTSDGMEIVKIPNEFYKISFNNFRFKDVTDKLGVVQILSAPRPEYKGLIGIGLTGKQYEGDALTLVAKRKTDNEHYYLQVISMIARDAMQAKLNGLVTDVENVYSVLKSGADFNYVIGISIPIREHTGSVDCATKLKSRIAGTYEVAFPLVNADAKVSFTVTPEYIAVLPEGGVAISRLRRDLKDDDYTLIVDMGHVTTDIAIFKGTTIYGKQDSSQWAGNALISNVRLALVDEGFNLTTEQAKLALETGSIRKGASTISKHDLFREEKERFVRNYLKEDVLQLLAANKVSPEQINSIVPIGAPMNDNGTGSIIQCLANEIGANVAEIKILARDLRYVNIEQTHAFTKLLYKKATRSK